MESLKCHLNLLREYSWRIRCLRLYVYLEEKSTRHDTNDGGRKGIAPAQAYLYVHIIPILVSDTYDGLKTACESERETARACNEENVCVCPLCDWAQLRRRTMTSTTIDPPRVTRQCLVLLKIKIQTCIVVETGQLHTMNLCMLQLLRYLKMLKNFFVLKLNE